MTEGSACVPLNLAIDGRIVKIKGLPYKANVDDIFAFFDGYSVQKDRIWLRRHPDFRPIGEAYVQFDTIEEAQRAAQKDRQTFHQKFGDRYVRVYPTLECDIVDINAAANQQTHSRSAAPAPSPSPFDSVVKVKSLPFDASQLDVIQFFQNYRLRANGVQLVVRSDSKPTGEAFVDFESYEEAVRAIREKDRCVFHEKFGDRFVRLIHVARKEMQATLAMRFGGEGILKMKGIPFKASIMDIRKFFMGFKVKPGGIAFIMHSDGRPTGMAFVEFETPQEAIRALEKDRATFGAEFGGRFCMLQLVGKHELDKVKLMREEVQNAPQEHSAAAIAAPGNPQILTTTALAGKPIAAVPGVGGMFVGPLPIAQLSGFNGVAPGAANVASVAGTTSVDAAMATPLNAVNLGTLSLGAVNAGMQNMGQLNMANMAGLANLWLLQQGQMPVAAQAAAGAAQPQLAAVFGNISAASTAPQPHPPLVMQQPPPPPQIASPQQQLRSVPAPPQAVHAVPSAPPPLASTALKSASSGVVTVPRHAPVPPVVGLVGSKPPPPLMQGMQQQMMHHSKSQAVANTIGAAAVGSPATSMAWNSVAHDLRNVYQGLNGAAVNGRVWGLHGGQNNEEVPKSGVTISPTELAEAVKAPLATLEADMVPSANVCGNNAPAAMVAGRTNDMPAATPFWGGAGPTWGGFA